jgi:hypothetical protein
VITAYEEKSLGTLWLMDAERECRAMTDTVSIIRYLKCECDEVAKAVNQLRQRKQALMESADWQLKERVFDAAQSGGDLIRIIEQNIQSQIHCLPQID